MLWQTPLIYVRLEGDWRWRRPGPSADNGLLNQRLVPKRLLSLRPCVVGRWPFSPGGGPEGSASGLGLSAIFLFHNKAAA